MGIKDFTDEELRTELDRRIKQRKNPDLVRCRDCKHLREAGWELNHQKWCRKGIIPTRRKISKGAWRRCSGYEGRGVSS